MIKNDKYIYQQICENIRRDIVSGIYKSGQKIDPNKICNQCKASYQTVMHALQVLQSEKLIRRNFHGNNKGYYISENPFTDDIRNLNADIKRYRIDMLTNEHLRGVSNIIKAQYAGLITDSGKHSLLDLCALEISARLLYKLAECMPDNTDILTFLDMKGSD